MRYVWLLLVVLVFVNGCIGHEPPNGTTVDTIQTTLLNAERGNRAIAKQGHKVPITPLVDAVLMPQADYMLPGGKVARQRRFNLTVQDVPAKAFFMSLVEGTPYSVVVDPKVEGVISLNLKNVTIDDVLQAVRDTYGYGFRVTNYGFEVLPTGLRTQIFTVDYLNLARDGETETSINNGQPTRSMGGGMNGMNGINNMNSMNNNMGNGMGPTALVYGNRGNGSVPSSSVKTKSKVDFWKNLDDALKTMVGANEANSFVLQPQAGIVVVRADSETLREVQDYLQQIQSHVNRQVILEAKILEVVLNDDFQTGINWRLFGFTQGDDLTAGASSKIGSIFSLNMPGAGAFSGFLKLLSTQGNVQVLSNPRIATLNNQKAVIKVGDDKYFVTGLTSTAVATGTTADTTRNVDLVPFFSGIALDVTPQIDNSGDVILHIHPVVSTVKQDERTITIGDSDLKLPSAASEIRESDSIVRAKNGQVIVIGGLMQSKHTENLTGTPGLSDIPVVGTLFRNTKQAAVKSELVILLRPMVIAENTWTEDLSALNGEYKQLKRGFHLGNKPHVFGNTAERRPGWLGESE